ncbi:hypothetical protein RF11_03235 [Thelohanellus kitauei]|uniref:Uncharacterized protein n=1 Tax=Thelohanellus kitauei TaxID=669202 RepID=A0A0C2MIL0_THEKT|nr:hypothetical protein RF11_03235 [Thelohanellus kitauei]
MRYDLTFIFLASICINHHSALDSVSTPLICVPTCPDYVIWKVFEYLIDRGRWACVSPFFLEAYLNSFDGLMTESEFRALMNKWPLNHDETIKKQVTLAIKDAYLDQELDPDTCAHSLQDSQDHQKIFSYLTKYHPEYMKESMVFPTACLASFTTHDSLFQDETLEKKVMKTVRSHVTQKSMKYDSVWFQQTVTDIEKIIQLSNDYHNPENIFNQMRAPLVRCYIRKNLRKEMKIRKKKSYDVRSIVAICATTLVGLILLMLEAIL